MSADTIIFPTPEELSVVQCGGSKYLGVRVGDKLVKAIELKGDFNSAEYVRSVNVDQVFDVELGTESNVVSRQLTLQETTWYTSSLNFMREVKERGLRYMENKIFNEIRK